MIRDQDIPFVYESGVLRPQGHVDLPEGSRGIASIKGATISTGSGETARRGALEVIRRIGDSGRFNSRGLKLTRDQMHERG